MSAWGWLMAILGHHLIPAVLSSAIVYLALAVLFGPLRVRRAAYRVAFLYAALLKAALAAWMGAGLSCLAYDRHAFGHFLLRLPNVLPSSHLLEARELVTTRASSHLAWYSLLGILGLAVALLCYRWVRLAPVYRSLSTSRREEPSEWGELFGMFDDLVARAYGPNSRRARPRLIVIRDVRCVAFTVGVRPPTIVLSADLVVRLETQEIQAILAHELAHAHRGDYLGRWLATVLRDVMVWNPFALAWYDRLVEEQEKACDGFAAELLGDPLAVASGLLEVGAYARELPATSTSTLAFWHRARGLDALRERLDRLAEGTQSVPRIAKLAGGLLYAGMSVFLLVQPYVVLSFPTLASAIWH